jgi:hypothetical protein
MQDAPFRYLILIAVLAAGNVLLATLADKPVAGTARWPADDAFYAVAGWVTTGGSVEEVHGAYLVQRDYLRPDGAQARLAIITSPEAKRIYKATADAPFLGSGFTVDRAPPSVVPPAPGREALVARRGQDLWLVLYAYGERRGLLGNGPYSWGMVALDSIVARPNHYFRANIIMALEGLDPARARHAVALADTLFLRLASWYGQVVALS